MRELAGLVFVAVLVAAAAVVAQEKFGVAVYAGAKPDTAVAEAVQKMLKSEAACYRTTDSVQKVVAFYKSQANLTVMGTTDEGGMFQKKGDEKVSLTVQSPWMDMGSGQMMKDTLITIVKQ